MTRIPAKTVNFLKQDTRMKERKKYGSNRALKREQL
ncbi:30S ribosomal protein S9 [Candidatus Saccharibacteria bacterium]|nr:30S ribosomal protein S9 [Candidatus Saccharibacteria bacterium]